MTVIGSTGLSDRHWQHIKTAFEAVRAPNQNLRVWLFGSRARGDHRPGSDVDLLVEAVPELTKQQLSVISRQHRRRNVGATLKRLKVGNNSTPKGPISVEV